MLRPASFRKPLTPTTYLSRGRTSATASKGFALIVALSLMAFILVLLLSLSQLVQVEVSVGTMQANMNKARQNALLGLNTALGQLQKLAGPDQRVTAEAAIFDDSPGDPSDITGVNQPHWVGVWNAIYPTDAATGEPVSVHDSVALQNYRNTARRINMQASPNDATQANTGLIIDWLVSNPNNANPRTYNAAATDITLVDEGSVGIAVATDKVTVPRVPITRSNGDIEGYYAYWVGDEGVKARFNQIDPYREGTLLGTPSPVPNNVNIGSLALLMAQRPGFEHAIELDTVDFDLSSRTFSQRDLELNDLGGTDPTTTRKGAFHDVTFFSRGVLSDVRYGGLKQDLTPYLSDTTGTIPEPTARYTATPNAPIADYPGGLSQTSDTSPTWDELQSFYQLKEGYNADGTIDAQTAAGNEHPVGPVLLQAAMDFMPEIDTTGLPPSNQFFLKVHVDFQVVLWNPYSTPMVVPESEIEYMVSDQAALLYPVFVKADNNISGGQFSNTGSGDIRVIEISGATSGNPSHKGISDNTGDSYGSLFQHKDFISYRGVAGSHDNNVTGLVFTLPETTLAAGEVATFSIAASENGNEYATNAHDTLLEKGVTNSTVSFDYGDVTSDVTALQYTDTNGNEIGPRFIFANRLPGSTATLPQGQVRGLGIMTPINTGSRDLQDTSGNIANLNRYYSRLYGDPYARVDLANSQRTSQMYQTTAATSTYAPASWLGSPNSDNKFRYHSAMYPATDGPGADTDSNLAMFKHRNPLAVHFTRDGIDYSGNEAYAVPGWETNGVYVTPSTMAASSAISFDPWDTNNNAAYFGPSTGATTGLTNVIVAELPPEDIPMASLGYLQQARLAHNDNSPAFQVGNSFPEIRLGDRTELSRTGGTDYNQQEYHADIIDTTYLLNDALWDSYFLSTLENPNNLNTADYVPVNSRLSKAKPSDSITAAEQGLWTDFAAGNVMVDGAFNVNSTSVDAWKAFLGSMSDLRVEINNGNNSNTVTDSLVSHYVHPVGGDFGGNPVELWTGYRALTDAELQALAEAMVEQVKRRGPFLSMSEFVNRRLADDATGNSGALQAAIDNSGINATAVTTAGNGYVTAADATGLPDLFIQEAAGGHQFTGTGAWITQGDILQAQGPNMTVRSDTFVIRAYGSYLNPLTNDVESEAWCEAVVQRMPDPVYRASNDDALPAYFVPDTNQPNFGRKFEIVAFRWLSEEEI